MGGVVTLYRKKLDFLNSAPNTRGELSDTLSLFNDYPELDIDESTMNSVIQFDHNIWGETYMPITDPEKLREEFRQHILNFLCKSDDGESMICGLENAYNVTKKITLPILNKAIDLNACVDHYYRLSGVSLVLQPLDTLVTNNDCSDSDGLILIKTGYRGDGLKLQMDRSQKRTARLIEEGHCGYSQKQFEDECKGNNDFVLDQIALRDKLLDDPALNANVLSFMEQRKTANKEKLRSYGINI